MSDAAPCPAHPDRAVEVCCQSCGRALCAECWRRTVDDEPWCEGCIPLLERPTPSVLFLAFAAIATVMTGLAIRALPLDVVVRWILFGCSTVAIGFASLVLHRRASRERLSAKVSERPAAPPIALGIYRGRAARIGRRLAPPISGRMATAIVAGILGLIAAVVPSVLAMPRWIEVELVLTAWWLVWMTTFAVLLHGGWRVARDFGARAEGMALGEPKPDRMAKRSSGASIGGFDIPAVDGEGCLVMVAILAIVAVTAIASWFLIELIIPGLAVAIYWLVLRGLARVANDQHGCEGKPLRAAVWGGLWASVFTLPLVVLVGFVHFMVALHPG